MKFNLSIVFFLYLFSQNLNAQIEDIQSNVFGDGNNLTEGFNAIESSQGGFLVLGAKSFQDIDNLSDHWVIKIDQEGNFEWEYLIDYGETGLFDFAYNAIEQSDGYIIVGNFSNPSTFTVNSTLTKIDFDGNLVWSNVLNESLSDRFSSVAKIDNDQFIIGGYATTNNNQQHVALSKFTSDGTLIWRQDYADLVSNIGLFPYSDIAITEDGDILLASEVEGKAHLLKADENGERLWEQDLLLPGGAVSISVLENENLSVLTTMTHITNPSEDYLISLNKDGAIISSHLVENDIVEVVYDAISDPKNDLYIIGNDLSSDVGLLLKTNASGDTSWTHTFPVPDSLTGVLLNGIEISSNDQIIITGSGLLDINPTLKVVAYIYVAIITLDGEMVSTQFIDMSDKGDHFIVYPNPATEIVYFQTKKEHPTNLEFRLFNQTGQLVKTVQIQSNEFVLYREQLSNGIYFYQILNTDQKLIDQGRLIFQ